MVTSDRQRIAYVDWLRALAMVGVFAIHVCEVFNPWDEWHISNAERSRVLGEIAVLMAPWIMPLFILLAGLSAWYSLSHRSNAKYVAQRVSRVLVPLVVGTLLLVPPQVYLERRLRGQFRGSFLAFLPHFFDGIYPRGNFSWHHLWFLAHLFAYSIVALPLFRYLRSENGRQWLARVVRFSGGRFGLLWLALPLILERQLLWGLAPERHMLTSDWSNHALLFVAYVYGYVLAAQPGLGRAIDAQWRRALALAGVTTAVLVIGTWTDVLPGELPPPYSGVYLTFWTLYAVGAWAWMVAVLGMGRRWLTRETAALGYAREVGYGLYVVHQPIIVGVAFVVVQQRAGVAVKFAELLVLSVVGTVLATELLRRVPVVRGALGFSRSRSLTRR